VATADISARPILDIFIFMFVVRGLLFRRCLIFVVCARRSEAGNLNNGRRASSVCEMWCIRGFRIETAWRKIFEFLYIKASSVTECPCSRDYRDYPIIRVCVGFNLRVRWNGELNRVWARLIGISPEHTGPDSSDSRCSCTRFFW
jgi:hypothetical protein